MAPKGDWWARLIITAVGAAVLLVYVAGRMQWAPVLLMSSPPVDRLSAEVETLRQTDLRAIITSAGFECVAVTRTFRQGHDATGGVLWDASCDGGHAYAVTVYNDAAGSTRVKDCIELNAASETHCFVALP
jgi:hypothetical protein